ncbi:MAG: hypothetical protein JW395_3801 [Nitrospira sp.]|nr:hypothetical protein [Nitrospira sp.]
MLCKDAKTKLKKKPALPLLRSKGWSRIVSRVHDERLAHSYSGAVAFNLNMKHKIIKESGKTVHRRILSGSGDKKLIQLLAIAGSVRRVA